MSGRKGRSRKQAAAVVTEQPVVDAGQENVIADSTTETSVNGNMKNNPVDLEEPSIQKRGKPKKNITKETTSKKGTKDTVIASNAVTDTVVAVIGTTKPKGRGRKSNNIDDEEIPDEKVDITPAVKPITKRGRKKEILETNSDSIEEDEEKTNGNVEIPVDIKSLKKPRETKKTKTSTASTKQKNDTEKLVPKQQKSTKKSNDVEINIDLPLTEEDDDDFEENKSIPVIQPSVTTKKPRGRKKIDDDKIVTVAGKKHKINGTTNNANVDDDEVLPTKRERATKTKAKMNMKEHLASSIAQDNAEKAEHKKNKKKSAPEEKKPTTSRRGKREAASIEKVTEDNDEMEENAVEEDVIEKKSKIVADTKKRKISNDVAADTIDNKIIKKQPAEKKLKMNATATSYDQIDFNLSKDYNFKISSWNVAGLRAWLTKGGLEYITHEKPDIMCFQELKCPEDQIPSEAHIPGYHPYWLSKPGGFNGVAIYSKIMPINVEYGLGDTEQDDDSRVMTAEYEKFYAVCVYVPNSGRKLVTLPKRLRWNECFHKYLLKLNEKKPVIICGDMNVAHEEIDIANPKSNKRNAGFTQEERDGMSTLLSYGFVDTFRHFNPNKKDAYTYWTYMSNARTKNVGWRLDYFLVSEKFMPKIVDNVIRSAVLGSDHCPITLFLNI